LLGCVLCLDWLTVWLRRELPTRFRPLSLPAALIVSIAILIPMWTIVEALQAAGW